MDIQFKFVDELGPEKVVELYDPDTGLKAIVVIDNTAAGPAIGGTRMAPDVSAEECFRLARAMTLKNAMAGLPHGGAKSVIAADPAMTAAGKNRLIDAFARAIFDLSDYIPGPDMGTNETSMARIHHITGRAAGLPLELGGIPLDDIGATAKGLVAAASAALPFVDLEFGRVRAVIQGFGAVGLKCAEFLCEQGVRIVGVSDSRGARVNPHGLDVAQLLEAKAAGRSVAEVASGALIDAAELLAVPCDLWIPAARPDVINESNVDQMDTRIVLQGANIPATEGAELRLAERNILVIPDFVANAGGVICASVEYRGSSSAEALQIVAGRIGDNVLEMLTEHQKTGARPRDVAGKIALERVRRAMAWRRPS